MAEIDSRQQATGFVGRAVAAAQSQSLASFARRVWVSLLYRGSDLVYRRTASRYEAYRTSGVIDLKDLTIESDSATEGVHDSPTPRPVVRWLDRLLPRDTECWNFLDIGCGRGRIVQEAARRRYARVIGIDFAAETYERARRNLAALPAHERRARQAEIRHGDATEIELPEGPCIFYLFNPFGAAVLNRFLQRISHDAEAGERPIVIAYYNPHHADVFARFPEFVACRLPTATRWRFAVFSPYTLNLYANGPALDVLRRERGLRAEPGA